MFSRQNLSTLCLLIAATENAESFSIPKARSSVTTKGDFRIRSETSLSVIMGGSVPDLADIPVNNLGYQDNILENVNDRAISLFDQFRDASGFEQFVASQDNFAQVASFLAARSDNVQDIVVGGSSTTLSAIPDTVMDSVGDRLTFLGQLDGESVVAAATVAASTTSGMGDVVDASQMLADSSTTTSQASDTVSAVQQQLTDAVAQATSQPVVDTVLPSKDAVVDAFSISGAQSSNKVVALMEKTILSFDDLAAKSGDSLEDAAKQLSDQLYQSFGSVDSAQASIKSAPKFIVQQSDAALQGALDEANRVFESGTSKIVEKGVQTMQTAKETPVKAVLNNVVHVIEEVMKVILKTMDGLLGEFSGSTFSGHIQHFQASLTGLVGDTTQKIDMAIHDFGKLNLQQITKFVLQEVILFVEALAKIFMTLVDALLTFFTGDTLVGHIQHLQADVVGAIHHSTQQLSSAVNDLGQINVQEAAQLIVGLVTFVAKILFQVFSAIVVVLSGQGINDWTLQATGAIEQELRQISLQASQTAVGVAESSVAELGTLLMQLLESTTALVVEGLQALIESFGVMVQAGGPLTGAMASDAVQSVSDGVSIMTANL